jgi:hypothetical protein
MITNIIAVVKDILEFLSLISAIVIGIAAILGLRQINIMKQDMKTRNERASKEKAIEYTTRYACNFVDLADKLYSERKLKKIPHSFRSEIIGDFTRDSLSRENQVLAAERVVSENWHKSMNELQIIAAAFSTGVADEKVGFSMFGRSFCDTVTREYDTLSIMRSDRACKFYQNIVDLFSIWYPRLSRAELEELKNNIDNKLITLPDKTIPSIGNK